MSRSTYHRGEAREGRRPGTRRLIAGLRITAQDEALLNVVRPFLPEADSESELAYRLWRRGLELTLAEVVGLGAGLPSGDSKEVLARLVAQRVLLCLPLLRSVGMLSLLGIETLPRAPEEDISRVPPQTIGHEEAIDQTASDAITDLGGGDFL
jgi:hypothetical protein